MNQQPDQIHTDGPRQLVLDRLLDAPRDKIWRCWTEPALLMQWFCPLPWKVTEARMDVRPGGASFMVMEGPEGQRFPNAGQYLEIRKNEKLVFTDAFVGDWEPSEKPFFTGIITLTDAGGGTRYLARALHWSEADCHTHREMGFHEGWGKATDQLEALCRQI
jgi:uncharacterized protein YndB with AHSA1/START domain